LWIVRGYFENLADIESAYRIGGIPG